LTLHDGQTLLVEEPGQYSVDDSLVVANDDDSIVAHFEYEEGALATAVAGQHAGRIGTIDEIQVTASSSDNNVLLSANDGGQFETVEAYIVVIDENFVEDDSTDQTDTTAESGDGADGETADSEADGETADSEADSETESDTEDET
jgi:SSU ribosomal protein S4E